MIAPAFLLSWLPCSRGADEGTPNAGNDTNQRRHSGRRLGVGPESILPVVGGNDERWHRGYGFRALARARPGMTAMICFALRRRPRPDLELICRERKAPR